jgi:hypothetical protein
MSKKIIPFVVAFILVCLVMIVAGVFAFSGAVTAEKFGSNVVWSKAYTTAESMKVIDLTGDGQDELFVQNTSNITVFDGAGNVLLDFPYSSPKTTLGDINGDGVDDIVVFYIGNGIAVDMISKGQVTTLAQNLSIGTPSRVAVIRFASGPQIVLGDSSGQILSLGLDGGPRWNSNLGSGEIRGMDDALIGGKTNVAIADIDGTVAVFDDQDSLSGTTPPYARL